MYGKEDIKVQQQFFCGSIYLEGLNSLIHSVTVIAMSYSATFAA